LNIKTDFEILQVKVEEYNRFFMGGEKEEK